MSNEISDATPERSRPLKSVRMKSSPTQSAPMTELSTSRVSDDESHEYEDDDEISMSSRNDMSGSINGSENGKGSQEEAHSDGKSQDR